MIARNIQRYEEREDRNHSNRNKKRKKEDRQERRYAQIPILYEQLLSLTDMTQVELTWCSDIFNTTSITRNTLDFRLHCKLRIVIIFVNIETESQKMYIELTRYLDWCIWRIFFPNKFSIAHGFGKALYVIQCTFLKIYHIVPLYYRNYYNTNYIIFERNYI